MPPKPITRNTLFYGDNLPVLREHIPDESIDLIYLDPPFNSNRSYNVLFKDESGRESDAQITAFDDTWHWGRAAEDTYRALCTEAPDRVGAAIGALRQLIGANQMMAYLVMMAARLVELHRVLKPTGSLYLHCDPTASHYLKVVMDAIFGPENFLNEFIWKRTSAHSDTKQGSKQAGRIHDVVLFYVKGENWTWNPVFMPYDQEYIDNFYRYADDDGRRFRVSDLTAAKPGGDTEYEWRIKRTLPDGLWVADLDNEYLHPKNGVEYKGIGPYKGRYWAYSRENMEKFEREGRLYYASTGMPSYKRYLDEMPGMTLQDVWMDIQPLAGSTKERLGYPTQKPLALLERIIQASSNPGDRVLDPFCVTGDTLIVTESGLKRIDKVRVGEYVLTHRGRYRRVNRVYVRNHSGGLLTLTRARANIGLQITPNHPVLAIRHEMCPYEDRRCLPRECRYHRVGHRLHCPNHAAGYRLEWIPAGELREGDFVYYPNTRIDAPTWVELPDSSHFNANKLPSALPVTSELMEWIGYYAAEGFVDRNSVHFANYAYAERIAELGASLFGLKATIKLRPSHTKHIRFHSRPLSLWMESQVGKGAANKHLPEWALGVSGECRHALVCGLLRGDGSFRQDKPDDKSHSYRYASASPTLSHQLMRLLLLDGIACSFNVNHPNPEKVHLFGKRLRVNHPSYVVAAYDVVSVTRLLDATGSTYAYTDDVVRMPYESYPFEDGWLYSLKSIEREQTTVDVYNLEVDEDHSYVTSSFTLHNCGCGTAVAAAHKLGRRWIGIDITHLSIALQKYRLEDMFQLKPGVDYAVIGEPTDVAGARQLAQDDRYQFQWWALSLVRARPLGGEAGGRQGKKGADRGIDGVITFIDDARAQPKRVLVQVKSGHVGRKDVAQLVGDVEREKAALGVFITLEEPTGPMLQEAVEAGHYHSPGWNRDYPRIQILTIAELLAGKPVNMPPTHMTFKQAGRVEPEGAAQGQLDL